MKKSDLKKKATEEENTLRRAAVVFAEAVKNGVDSREQRDALNSAACFLRMQARIYTDAVRAYENYGRKS